MSPVKQIRNPITGAVVQVELAGETPTQREASALMRTFRLQAEQQVGRDLAAGIDPFGGVAETRGIGGSGVSHISLGISAPRATR